MDKEVSRVGVALGSERGSAPGCAMLPSSWSGWFSAWRAEPPHPLPWAAPGKPWQTLWSSPFSIYVSRMSGSLLHVSLGGFHILPCPVYVLSWLVAKLSLQRVFVSGSLIFSLKWASFLIFVSILVFFMKIHFWFKILTHLYLQIKYW